MRWPRVVSRPAMWPYMQRLHGPVAQVVQTEFSLDDPHAELQHVLVPGQDFDLVHAHLRGGRTEIEHLHAMLRAGRHRGDSIVLTVHDLAGIDSDDTRPEVGGLLGQALSAADVVTTFTTGCAERLQEHTGRGVEVVPHGPLLADRIRQRLRAAAGGLVPHAPHVLLVLARGATDADIDAAVAALAEGPFALPVTVLAGKDRLGRIVDRTEAVPWVQVECLTAEEGEPVAARMAAASAVVLVASRATHSPLIELAADVGAPVITTDAGCLQQQLMTTLGGRTPAPPLPVHSGHVDQAALAERLRNLEPTHNLPRAHEVDRERADHSFRYHHERIYRRCLALSSGRHVDLQITHHRPAGEARPQPRERALT